MYKLVRISSTFTLLTVLSSPLLSSCNIVNGKEIPLSNEPTISLETIAPTPVAMPTKTAIIIPSPTPTIETIPTPEPTPSSGICTYAEEATMTQYDIGQICVAKFKINGKEKRAFFSPGITEKGHVCYDVFTERPMFYDLPDTFIPSEEVEKLIDGKFEAIGYNGLRTYLQDIGVDKPLSELRSYKDLRLLYERIIPKDQWFIMPWDIELLNSQPKVLEKQ